MKKSRMSIVGLIAALMLWMSCAPTWAAQAEVKRYDADARIQNLRIEVSDRKIVVQPSADERIHLGYSETGQDFYEISVQDGDTLVVESKTNKKWYDYIGFKADESERTLTLELPALSSLEISTTNEDIELPEMSLGEKVSVKVNNGDIRLERLDAGQEIHLETKNGNITGVLAGGYDDFDITAQVKEGDSSLPERKEGGAKKLNVYVNNGDIRIKLEPGN